MAVPVIIVDKDFKLTKTVSGKSRQQVDNKQASRQYIKVEDNKCSISTINYYEHMIRKDHFNLASVSENLILTILKVAALDCLSERFLQDGFLAKSISHLCNPSINSDKFQDPCKVTKFKPLYKKVL